MSERYNKLSDLPKSLPLFPLRGVILLPRTTLPFNIFEPRYLEMIDHVLAGNRLIGLIQPCARHPSPIEGNEPKDLEVERYQSPQDRSWPLRGSGCIGRLTSFEEQEDGHLAINLTGIARFKRLEETDMSQPWRISQIDVEPYLSDLDASMGEQDVDRDKLLSLLRLYLEAHDMNADWRSIHRSSTAHLVNTLSIHSPYGSEEKQALQEAPDLKSRAEMLMALAEMELASKNEGGGTLQ